MDAIKKVKTEKRVARAERDEIFDAAAGANMDYEVFGRTLAEMVDKRILVKAADSEHYDLLAR